MLHGPSTLYKEQDKGSECNLALGSSVTKLGNQFTAGLGGLLVSLTVNKNEPSLVL